MKKEIVYPRDWGVARETARRAGPGASMKRSEAERGSERDG